MNYKREIVSFRASIQRDQQDDKWVVKNGKFDIAYKINGNIAQAGLLLAAGAALVQFAWVYAIPAEAT